MGENSMSMLCLIVVYLCAIAHCLPFYDEGLATHTDGHGDFSDGKTQNSKDVPPIYFNIGDKGQNDNDGPTRDTLDNNGQFPAQTESRDSAVIDAKYANLYKIVNYILLKSHRYSNMDNQTKTTIEVSDVNSADDKIKDNANLIGSADDTSSPDTSNSVGFRRETALIPGHRKRRQRRSFFLDFGMGDIFAEDVGDVIFSAHTSPCQHDVDRHFCLNGGTCVFVAALGIKTCRCRIGYTGLRCEMINQEYILALLADDFFFS